MTVLTLYGKPGCCLCDDAKAAIESVRARRPFELREVDVSTDPVLHARYGERIPVLELDGEALFEYVIEPEELRRMLDTVGP